MQRSARGLATAALVGCVVLTSMSPVSAEPDTYPSQEQVDQARGAVETRQQAVDAIRARLAAANQRVEDAQRAAAVAAERYNGARWRLTQARAEARKARAEAEERKRQVQAQRDGIAMLVAQTYQDGTALNSINAFMGSGGPTAVANRYGVVQTASASMQNRLDEFAALSRRAAKAKERAEAAEAKREELFAEASQARDAAAAAASAAASEAATIDATRRKFIRRLAAAQDISVALATQREAALAEQRRAAAEAAARRAARQAAREAAQRAAEQAARAEAREAAREAAARRAARAASSRPSSPSTPKPSPPPAPSPPPPPPAPPAPSGGVEAVIAYARAQLGEPYVWGAAGPDSWDCSGLTMRAWAQAGVSLPHWSVGQYYASTPISASELRRGDLVFWSDNSSPDAIFHVALYIGDGQILHAPRTGQPVQITSMYYWVPPTHFARP